jgi:hypothetical protein
MLPLAALPLLLALQSAPSPTPAAAPDEPLVELPLKLDYRVTSPKPETVLMTGQLQLRPFSTAAFEQYLSKSYEQVKMSVVLKPQRDGEVAVELQWEEGTAAGRIVKWSMSLLGKRGEPMVGTVAWPGDSRTVTLTVR